jgi:hypothetical protein
LRHTWLSGIVTLVIVAAVTGILTYPLCGALFRCGCVTVWAGAADHCNVHATVGPHCPWCESSALGAMGFVVIVAGQAAAWLLARRRGAAPIAATLVAVAALPLAALFAGALTFLLSDYPHFLVHNARARTGIPEGPVTTRIPEVR